MTQVREVMTMRPETARPQQSLRDAAQRMSDLDVGVLPVCDKDGGKLLGVVTDRDIVVKAVTRNVDLSHTDIASVMSTDLCWCYEDDELDEALEKMGQLQIRRLPVISREKELVGILSLGDAATRGATGMSGQSLRNNSEPAQPSR